MSLDPLTLQEAVHLYLGTHNSILVFFFKGMHIIRWPHVQGMTVQVKDTACRLVSSFLMAA